MKGYLDSIAWLRGLIRATLRPRPRIAIWQWADTHVHVPEESGGPHPGQLNTGRFPIFRGLFDLAQRPGVHYFALCASARVGKTLFTICILLYWIAERVGAVVWLDPSGISAKKFVRNELDAFLQRCRPVWALAVVSKTTWITLWKTFRGKILRIVASGAEADMHGFNAELAIINELDRCKGSTSNDASSPDKIIARTRLFPNTRLIVENSTPGVAGEFSPIWQRFLRGSQHHCYLPCPWCSADAAVAGRARVVDDGPLPAGWSPLSREGVLAGWQRLTFSIEKKLVPFDEELRPLLDESGALKARNAWREETTGQIHFEQFALYGERTSAHDATRTERVKLGYDIDAAERDATYQCAHCRRDIPFVKLRWMLARYRWMAHNPAAARDRISAHVWAGYSPFEGFGLIAKEFIEAMRDLEALIKFHNFTLGLPFVRQGTAIKEDDLDRVIARTPVRYVKGQLPMEAEILTMTVDKNSEDRWYSIRAWGVLWDHPERPTWSALVDWGCAHSWEEVLELAGLKPDATGHERRFQWVDPNTQRVREYLVTAGLVDSGDDADLVYQFCFKQTTVFDPYKGVAHTHTRGSKVRMSKALDEQLDLWLCWSDYFAANLYYDCIKYGTAYGQSIQWWLPTDLDADYRRQLTDEFQGPDGWTTRTKTNHLGDTEKMHRPLEDKIEETLDAVREERAIADERAKVLAEGGRPK